MNDIILKYLQGNASEKEKEVLLGWLRAAEENKKAFSEIRDRWLEKYNPLDYPEYVKRAFDRFALQVEDLTSKQKRRRLSHFYKVAASVAALFICSLGGYFAGSKLTIGPLSSKPIVMNHVIMGKDSKGSVILPDGTLVWLNANSRLTYPKHFSGGNRHVQLEGEGYFEVVHDKEAPFLVETDGMVVNVLGTHFNVKNYEDRKIAETTLLSGKVKAYLPASKQNLILKPNQRLACNRKTGGYKVADVDASDYIIWIGDKLVCTNEPLETILNKIKHWYNIDVECKTGVPMHHRLSLTIRQESPQEIYKLLTLICPIKYTIKQHEIIIEPK